jgi:hypothetical protein
MVMGTIYHTVFHCGAPKMALPRKR